MIHIPEFCKGGYGDNGCSEYYLLMSGYFPVDWKVVNERKERENSSMTHWPIINNIDNAGAWNEGCKNRTLGDEWCKWTESAWIMKGKPCVTNFPFMHRMKGYQPETLTFFFSA